MVQRIEFGKRNERYIVKEYRKGYGMALIGREFGCSPLVIRRVLERKGVKIRKRGRTVMA